MGRGRPRYPDVLTPREWEVLALVRSGLTNDEIAKGLGISPRTAKYHVSEIIGKLGVSDRRVAARWERELPAPRSWALAPLAWLARNVPRFSITSGRLAGPTVVASGGVLATAAAGASLFALLVLRVGTTEPIARGPALAHPVITTTASVRDVVLPTLGSQAGEVYAEIPTETSTPTVSMPKTPAKPTATPTRHVKCATGGCITPTEVEAPASTASLNFALGVDVDADGTNDCGTGVPIASGDGLPDPVAPEVSQTSCVAAADAMLAVRVYLTDAGGFEYVGQESRVYYYGLDSSGVGGVHWPCTVFESSTTGPSWEGVASVISGLDGSSELCSSGRTRTEVGLLNEFTLACTQGGGLALGHGAGETGLIDDEAAEHHEAGEDVLSITCGDRTPLPPSSRLLSITQRAMGPGPMEARTR